MGAGGTRGRQLPFVVRSWSAMLMRYDIRIETELRSSLIIISNTEARETLKPNMEIIVVFSKGRGGGKGRCHKVLITSVKTNLRK